MKKKFKPIQRGIFYGFPAIHLEFEKEDGKLSNEAIANLIISIKHLDVGLYKTISLSGDFPDEKMLGILKSLTECGFLTQLVVDGKEGYKPWYFQGGTILVELDSPVWPPFKCSELHYKVKGLKQPDPELPQQPWPKLYLESEMEGGKIFQWLRKSKLAWFVQRRIEEDLEI